MGEKQMALFFKHTISGPSILFNLIFFVRDKKLRGVNRYWARGSIFFSGVSHPYSVLQEIFGFPAKYRDQAPTFLALSTTGY